MQDRFEIGRDMALAILAAIGEQQDRTFDTMGEQATIFEIIGVLQMLANDYHDQLRRDALKAKEGGD